MSMKWRGQVADITAEDSQGTTLSIGIIDSPEVSVPRNVEELRGTGEVTWQDLQQTELAVEISGDIMQWDLDAWKAIVGYDEAADALRNDAEVPTFAIDVIYENTNGNQAVFPVPEAYDDSLPLGGSREEWIGMSLDARGQTIAGVDAESDTEVV